MAIQSFSCVDTQALFTTGRCPRFANIKKVAERKLAQGVSKMKKQDLIDVLMNKSQ